MNDPTSDLEAWAAAYREHRRPSAARRRAIRAGVRAGAAEQDRRSRRRRWLGLGVVLAAGVLGALALGRLLDGRAMRIGVAEDPSLAPHAAPKDEALQARDGARRGEAGGEATREPTTGAGGEVAGGGEAPGRERSEEGSAAAAGASRPASRRAAERRRADEPSPSPTPAAPDELEGMRLLRDAERTLETDAAASLRLLERHEQRFPASTLALEREALTVIALCRLGRLEIGRERQQAFLRRHGSSAYAARVRSACEAGP